MNCNHFESQPSERPTDLPLSFMYWYYLMLFRKGYTQHFCLNCNKTYLKHPLEKK